jgi:hypothetical protein
LLDTPVKKQEFIRRYNEDRSLAKAYLKTLLIDRDRSASNT